MPPRRTLEELEVRYRLEPNLVDVYVEGPRDKSLYSWFFDKTGCGTAIVYEVDTVEIDAEIVRSHSLEHGNRGRVIALTLELDRYFPETLNGVRGVADSDYNFVLGTSVSARHLLYTDYTSPELYMWKQDTLGRILALGFMVPRDNVLPIFESVSKLLQELFIIRAATKRLGWGTKLVEFIRCCTIDGPRIAFDRATFVERYLNAYARLGQKTKFEEVCDSIRFVHLSDKRTRMSGEDLVEIIVWYLKERYNWDGYRRNNGSAIPIVMGALDVGTLAEEELFRSLRLLCDEVV